MTPTLDELKKVCFSGNHPMNVYRNISIRITWLLIHLPISANFMTFFWIVLGITGAFLIGSSLYTYRVLGAFFIFLMPILDFVDGELARWHGTYSPQWGYLDWVGYWVMHLVALISLTYHFASANPGYYLVGFLALFAFSMYEFVRLHQFRIVSNKNKLAPTRVRYPLVYRLYLFIRAGLLFEYIPLLLLVFALLDLLQIYLFYFIIVFNGFWITKVAYEFFFGYKRITTGVRSHSK